MPLGNWMQTFTGEQFYPLDPNPAQIHIKDIAHALSLQCRYNGHCKHFYSVAQHSVLVSKLCSPENAFSGLMHDAAEAYLSDVISPIKPHLRGYDAIENRLLRVIFRHYGLSWPMPAEVKEVDGRMCITEGQQLMYDTTVWYVQAEPYDIEIGQLSPPEAGYLFLERFVELYHGVGANRFGS